MQDSKPVSTPADASQKLVKATDEEECINKQQYLSSLMYLSMSSRPDITYSVSTLARYSSRPNQQHWTALKRVLRYLKGTAKYGICDTRKRMHRLFGC